MWVAHALLSVAAVLLTALLGRLGSGSGDPSSRDWYVRGKPDFAPPSWVFGVVWPVLYALIAVALYLGLRARLPSRVLAVFAVNLALNAAWSPVFFRLGAVRAALGIAVALLLTALYLIREYLARSLRAGALLLAPYALWLAFATVLNAAFAVRLGG